MTSEIHPESGNLIAWLVGEAPRLNSPAELLDGYCRRLRDEGIAVDRATLGAPLLHPIAQSSYVFWNTEEGASQRWFQWTPETLESMHASPIYPIYTEGRTSSLILSRPADRNRYPIGEDLWEEGYHQYEALALEFSDRTHKVLTLATRSPDGFSAADLGIVRQSLPALALVFEGFVARNTARILMETYVGKRAGLRVLDGEIALGDGSHVQAVIWFADLRDFTGLAQRHSEKQLLDLLNGHFGLLTEVVEANSGEVLKFIGDAMLAVFPHDNDLPGAVARAEETAFAALARHDQSGADFSFGIGLHPGSVFYGNIGGGTRLDFTVIGPAVNIASRIEAMCGVLGEQLLASAELVKHSSRHWRPLGEFELKGVPGSTAIFAPNN